MHMDITCETLMKQRNNSRFSVDSSHDKTHSMGSQQGNAGVDNQIVSRVEYQTGAINMNMSQSKLSSGPRIIHIRSGWVSHRPQKLGIMEEQ